MTVNNAANMNQTATSNQWTEQGRRHTFVYQNQDPGLGQTLKYTSMYICFNLVYGDDSLTTEEFDCVINQTMTLKYWTMALKYWTMALQFWTMALKFWTMSLKYWTMALKFITLRCMRFLFFYSYEKCCFYNIMRRKAFQVAT